VAEKGVGNGGRFCPFWDLFMKNPSFVLGNFLIFSSEINGISSSSFSFRFHLEKFWHFCCRNEKKKKKEEEEEKKWPRGCLLSPSSNSHYYLLLLSFSFHLFIF